MLEPTDMKSSIDFQIFLKLYRDFKSIPTYTKVKKEKKKLLDDYLLGIDLTKINVKVTSKYNYCNRSYSFTIYRVPNNQLGNLYQYRGSQVLIICKSFGPKGWGKYWNEVFKLNRIIEETELKDLKNEFHDDFVLRL
jgi:hypothetical protein